MSLTEWATSHNHRVYSNLPRPPQLIASLFVAGAAAQVLASLGSQPRGGGGMTDDVPRSAAAVTGDRTSRELFYNPDDDHSDDEASFKALNARPSGRRKQKTPPKPSMPDPNKFKAYINGKDSDEGVCLLWI
jgi:hypothetical protein